MLFCHPDSKSGINAASSIITKWNFLPLKLSNLSPVKNSIRFFGDATTREPYDNFFTNYVKENGWNVFNSRSWSFPPTDGQLFIFPASLSHDVEEFTKERFFVSDVKDMLECRVAIAGDILLLGKEVISGNYRAVQPYNFWRKF